MNFLQKIYNIEIKEESLLHFHFFWAYGIYAAGTDKNSDLTIVYIFFPILILLIIFMLNKQNEIIFKFKSNIDFFLKIKITYFFL